MIILQEIKVKGYKNLKDEKLERLGDLNIIVGPNNSGKTSILKAIYILHEGKVDKNSYPEDVECEIIRKKVRDLVGFVTPLQEEDVFQGREEKVTTTISYCFSEKFLKEIGKSDIDTFRKELEKKISGEKSAIKHFQSFRKKDLRSLTLHGKYKDLRNEHITYLLQEDIWAETNKRILYCDDNRLERYKEKPITEYIKEKNLGTDILQNKLIKFLQATVDPRINALTSKTFDVLMQNGFKDTIDRQGSGVRSLICLGLDIITAKEGSIVLIDEPELGSDPAVKQEFLKFLLEEAKQKQIFITTHDPTFVNPILWKKQELFKGNVQVFIRSIVKEKFVKVDLKGGGNRYLEEPSTFAGYLPHTTSLRDIHIYVEGTSDVGVFQVLLYHYLRKKYKQDWLKKLNRTGIYHLAGDHWMHLLHTIPRRPYTCVVVLDRNKSHDAIDISLHSFSTKADTPDFKFCGSSEQVSNVLFGGEKIPIYCLSKNDIGDYFRDSSSSMKYKSGLPNLVALRMENGGKIPQDIEELFDVIFVSTGFSDLSTKDDIIYLLKRLKSQGAIVYYSSSLKQIIINPKGPYKVFGIDIRFGPGIAKHLTSMLKIQKKEDFEKVKEKITRL